MKKVILRSFISTVVIYFLFMIIVLANGASVLGQSFYPYFYVAANSMGLNTSWNFFSPDPAHVIYLKSLIIYQDEYGQTLKDSVEEFYPIEKDEGNFGVVARRDSYASRFFMVDARRIERFFAPWVCKRHPGASRVYIEGNILSVPSLEQAETEQSRSVKEMQNELRVHSLDYTCEKNN